MDMKEFIYHALGICGEHSHPNLINITFIILSLILVGSIIFKLKNQK
jgi:hypothetical protein